MDAGQDRRRYARFELLEYALVRPAETDEAVRSVVTDVSLGGLQIRSRRPFAGGEVCEIEIGGHDATPLKIRAEARYSAAVEDSDLFSTGFKCVLNAKQERMGWVDYVHQVFQTQGERLVG